MCGHRQRQARAGQWCVLGTRRAQGSAALIASLVQLKTQFPGPAERIDWLGRIGCTCRQVCFDICDIVGIAVISTDVHDQARRRQNGRTPEAADRAFVLERCRQFHLEERAEP